MRQPPKIEKRLHGREFTLEEDLAFELGLYEGRRIFLHPLLRVLVEEGISNENVNRTIAAINVEVRAQIKRLREGMNENEKGDA